jgi:hypothetical protein
MASKRNTGSESVVSGGAAPARAKNKNARKHLTAAVASPITETSVAIAPQFEEIARLAYSYWEARGYQGGSSEEDWLRAEQELSA